MAEDPSRRRYFVLGLLFLVYLVNFVDRQILSILIEPVKHELGVTDTAMGFLTGLTFALFYSVAGIPLAWLADQFNRRNILAAGLGVWSAMTALSGLAVTFWQLALARVGVGVGEASCVPTAHSLISDYFPPKRRATALAVFSMGAHAGVMAGLILGGWVNEWLGWRWAFVLAGSPGVLLALIVRLTVREPQRGNLDPVQEAQLGGSFGEVLSFLWKLKAFRNLALASGLASITGYGLVIWSPVFLIRVYGMGTGETGTWLGLLAGAGGVLGTLGGGLLGDRLSVRDSRWLFWIPALSQVLTFPLLLWFLFARSLSTALGAAALAYVFSALWMGPAYAATQALARPAMRALAAALLLLVINLIGLGLGPLLVGWFSDLFQPQFGPESIRYALAAAGLASLWAGVHYARGALE